uniref:Uncharacterized protein n=1 Tax=Oryza punctata TaxID=4537 RepID=A0A0E0M486_ORYPU
MAAPDEEYVEEEEGEFVDDQSVQYNGIVPREGFRAGFLTALDPAAGDGLRSPWRDTLMSLNVVLPFSKMDTTDDMSGLLFGLSSTHKSPTWMQSWTSSNELLSAMDESTRSLSAAAKKSNQYEQRNSEKKPYLR